MFQSIRKAWQKLSSSYPNAALAIKTSSATVSTGAAAALRTRLFDHAIPDNKNTTQDLAVTNRKLTNFIEADRSHIKEQEQQIRYWQQRAEAAEAKLKIPFQPIEEISRCETSYSSVSRHQRHTPDFALESSLIARNPSRERVLAGVPDVGKKRIHTVIKHYPTVLQIII
ncbi:hypothetical protein N0V90_006906 [Kalmusia sp. IMI 367209]|nr:hypothetical protein N0V90_006906 [Kalmusia sp. IMI 367209]